MNSSRGGKTRRVLKTALRWVNAFGLDPVRLRSAMRYLPATMRDYRSLATQNSSCKEPWFIDVPSPCFHDRAEAGGTASGHYFHQDLFVARQIFESNPEKHVDVGSRIDGFVAHVAVFREIEVFDIRPISTNVKNIKFVQGDITCLSSELEECCDSLSSLHAIEHFGLGRYGDPIDIDGYKKGFEVLTSMLKPGGILYLSVPIGRERIEFNAQRVFSVERVLALAAGRFDLIRFTFVDDEGDLQETADPLKGALAAGKNLEFGCGIFEFRKYTSVENI
jgi:hypothetical protein